MHDRPHPLAGRTVRLPEHMGPGELRGELAGRQFRIEDWWDHLSGASWRDAGGNPAALQYAVRAMIKGLPANDDVVYGKIGVQGYLLHVTEVEG
jgi:hypothetical protein